MRKPLVIVTIIAAVALSLWTADYLYQMVKVGVYLNAISYG